ncbi:MAG TPA: nuclear transport factor 2 family protein [Acidimicrobiales bacterium]|nr:nuclear transport factor 2 family protein [Acidimicrobiales bacterium]
MKPDPQDYVSIANLLAEYCLALDRDEIDHCVGLFTEDARFEVYGRSFDGREGIRKMMSSAPGGLHLGGPPLIEAVSGDTAQVKQNLLFIDRSTGMSRRTLYTDLLVRSGDSWRIRRRRCEFITASGIQERPDGGGEQPRD